MQNMTRYCCIFVCDVYEQDGLVIYRSEMFGNERIENEAFTAIDSGVMCIYCVQVVKIELVV